MFHNMFEYMYYACKIAYIPRFEPQCTSMSPIAHKHNCMHMNTYTLCF